MGRMNLIKTSVSVWCYTLLGFFTLEDNFVVNKSED